MTGAAIAPRRDDDADRDWQAEIVAASDGAFVPVVVLEAVGSTQDEVRRRRAAIGTVVTARRQTDGRGSHGRRWADTGTDGAAISVALPVDRPARLMTVAALAALAAVDAALPGAAVPIGLKWPNDVLVGGRKIAGVLVEIAGDAAIVGIGVNVRQRSFPEPLGATATSIALHGATASRLDVLVAVVTALHGLSGASDDELSARYRQRDLLRGTRRAFSHAGGLIEGDVVEIDPMRAIVLRCADGELVRLVPEQTRLAEPAWT